jgi:hypothetical protein
VEIGVDQPITGAHAQLMRQATGDRQPALGHRAAQALLPPRQRGFDADGHRSQGANPLRRQDGQAPQQASRHLGGGPESQAVQGPGCV